MPTPPRPHPLSAAPIVERVNGWLERAWSTGMATRPSLNPMELWAKALRSAPVEAEMGGRSTEDAADFRLRINQLCASLQAEAGLSPLGLTMAHGQLVRVIRQRLRLGAMWQQRPELLKQTIAPPILVVGQMRSGTTRTHRLLASDPAHAGTRFCDSWHPVPPKSSFTPDMRPFWCVLSLAIGRRLNPWLDTIHPFGVTRPDEELGWLASALDHCAYEAQWRIPTFTAFSEARDPAPVYREFSRILRTDTATRANAHLPRVLKVPQFAEDLPALLAQFPDALVVRTRRDAEEIAASATSLVANQMAMQSDDADLAWIERECRRKIALREKCMNSALANFSGPLAEVDFIRIDRDWKAEMTLIYQQLGLPLSAAALTTMAKEQGRAQDSAHHGHQAAYKMLARA